MSVHSVKAMLRLNVVCNGTDNESKRGSGFLEALKIYLKQVSCTCVETADKCDVKNYRLTRLLYPIFWQLHLLDQHTHSLCNHRAIFVGRYDLFCHPVHVAHTKNRNLTQYSQQVSMNLVKMRMLSSKQDINKQNYLLFI